MFFAYNAEGKYVKFETNETLWEILTYKRE
jgi:hypothetical protein